MSHVKGNTLTMDGADRLAQAIEKYWLDRGYEPRVFVTWNDLVEHGRASSLYAVRSNMINGRPEARPRREG